MTVLGISRLLVVSAVLASRCLAARIIFACRLPLAACRLPPGLLLLLLLLLRFGLSLKPRSSSSAAKLGARENNSTPEGRRTWMCAVRHRDRMSRVSHACVCTDRAGT
jgi:hypothetical protein